MVDRRKSGVYPEASAVQRWTAGKAPRGVNGYVEPHVSTLRDC